MSRERFLSAVRGALAGALEEGNGQAVLLPRTGAEVAQLLRLAAHSGTRLRAPGSTLPAAGRVPLDLQRMSEVLATDETSRVVHAQAGIAVGALEHELSALGWTLGLRGAPLESSLSTWLARGAQGARDPADDPVDHLVAGLTVALPGGEVLSIRPAPRRAVGPDLIGAFVGGRARLGVITAAHLVVRLRRRRVTHRFLFPSRDAAEAALAWMRGRGVRPAATSIDPTADGVALCLHLEAEPDLAEAFARVARRTAEEHGGVVMDARDAPATRPPAEALPPSAIVEALAARLDPEGVLGS